MPSPVSAPPAGQPPLLDVEGAIATITLRRPAQANRIEAGDLEVLLDHFRQLIERRAAVRALVITGEGRHFSAGYDIGSVLDMLDAGAGEGSARNAFGDMVDALETLPQITLCALNGGVFGGSTDLALACDFRVGVPSTRLFMPAARLGLHYYPSGLRRFVSRLGLNEAKRLFLLAEEIDAEEMLRIGYLGAVVAADDLMTHAREMARAVVATAPLASAGMKAALNMLGHGQFDAGAVRAAELDCLRSHDFREGVAAWHEKRAPVFEGR